VQRCQNFEKGKTPLIFCAFVLVIRLEYNTFRPSKFYLKNNDLNVWVTERESELER